MTKTNRNGFFAQFTPDHLRAGYARNLTSLRLMLAKAEAVAPRKYRGFTVAQLQDRVAEYARLAVAGDADLRAHLG